MNFLMFKLVSEKVEEPEIKLPTSAGSWKKQTSSRKTSTSASLRASLVAQRLERLPAMRETQVQSLGWEDSPGEENGCPPQHSWLGDPMDRGAWQTTVHTL